MSAALYVECPECLCVLPIGVTHEVVDGDVELSADTTDVWAHVWTHEAT